MTAKQALEQIKALFADENPQEAASATPVEQFKEYQLADGAKVMIDNLAVGGKVTVEGPEGEIPAPAGDHILSDGTVITTDEAGLITEIQVPKIEVEIEKENETELLKKKVEEMEAKIEEMGKNYKEKMEAQAAEFSAMVAASESKLIALSNVLTEFFAAPSADPVAPEKFHSSKDDKVNRFLERAKNL
jgi:hypothetical protein